MYLGFLHDEQMLMLVMFDGGIVSDLLCFFCLFCFNIVFKNFLFLTMYIGFG